MSAATEKELGKLHSTIAKALIVKIDSGEANASDLEVARKFLADNDIAAMPEKNEDIQRLNSIVPFPEMKAK